MNAQLHKLHAINAECCNAKHLIRRLKKRQAFPMQDAQGGGGVPHSLSNSTMSPSVDVSKKPRSSGKDEPPIPPYPKQLCCAFHSWKLQPSPARRFKAFLIDEDQASPVIHSARGEEFGHVTSIHAIWINTVHAHACMVNHLNWECCSYILYVPIQCWVDKSTWYTFHF